MKITNAPKMMLNASTKSIFLMKDEWMMSYKIRILYREKELHHEKKCHLENS